MIGDISLADGGPLSRYRLLATDTAAHGEETEPAKTDKLAHLQVRQKSGMARHPLPPLGVAEQRPLSLSAHAGPE
jgi:hypothetical protein